jgi:hypothetical protein
MRSTVVKQALWLGVVVAFVVLALSACGGGGGGGDEGGGGAEAEPKQAKPREFPLYGELHEGTYFTDKFQPAFSFRVVDRNWVVSGSEERTLVEIRQGVEGKSLLAFLNPDQVFNPSKVRELDSMSAPEDMVAWLQKHPYLQTDDPQPATVGGVKGVRLDAVVASVPPTECGGNCLGLFTASDSQGGLEGSYDWVVYEKEKLRFIVLEDVGGERVTIVAEAPAEEFEEFAPKAQRVLDSVEWKDV